MLAFSHNRLFPQQFVDSYSLLIYSASITRVKSVIGRGNPIHTRRCGRLSFERATFLLAKARER